MTSNARRNAQYEKGLADERLVIEFLRTQGYEVIPSTQEENKVYDIDCWVNGKPVSIKSQHKGVAFRNIGFELANHLTTRLTCKVTEEILSRQDLTAADVEALIASGSWESSWWQNGTASNYVFLQGDRLRLYTKSSIQSYVAANGWLRVRSLTEDVRSYLGGSYRHCNSISGYLNWGVVPHRIWSVTNELPKVA